MAIHSFTFPKSESEPKWYNRDGDSLDEQPSFKWTYKNSILVSTLIIITLLTLLGVASKNHTSISRLQEDDNVPAFVLNGSIPQTDKDDLYQDRLVALNTSDPIASSTSTKGLRYAVLLPTFSGHFPQVVTFFQSLKCLCTDFDQIDINVIVSDFQEKQELEKLLSNLAPCGSKFSRFDITPNDRHNPKANIVTLYDILPPIFRTDGISANNSGPLLKEKGRYRYQSIKKLSAAFYFDYNYALWLDSEAIAVRPFSIRNTFDTYVKHPTVWRSRMSKAKKQHAIMENSARVLGRSIDSFGTPFWTLESVEWMVEKKVIQDMVQYVEGAHGDEFWKVWLAEGAPFEINLYNMHIHARKLETVDSIFSKYQVLETEREMIQFGMAPAFPLVEKKSGTGFLERGYEMLRKDGIQPNYSAFLRRYGQRLFRLDSLTVAPAEVIDRFLLDTPIDLLCSGAPPLHSWWTERLEKKEKGKSLTAPATRNIVASG